MATALLVAVLLAMAPVNAAAEGVLPVAAPPAAEAAVADEAFLQGRSPYYVRYAPGFRGAVEKAVVNAGGEVTHRLPRVESFAVLLSDHAAEALARNPHVALVEPVPEHRIAGQVVPYNIDQYQARDIWDKNRDGFVDPGAPDGSGVRFCIIDTGMYAAHDDFVGVTMSGHSQINGEEWWEDGNGHGTHVAGTANAVHNSIGVVGTMPGGAELIILKVFSNDGRWVTGQSNLGEAAQICRDMGANVLSMSLGGGFSSTENNIFQGLYDNDGILNIAAAGNSGDTTRSYPASYDSVISVGAIDRNEVAAEFTQYPDTNYDPDNPPANGHWDVVELSGGGVDVMSTWPGSPFFADGELPIFRVDVGEESIDGAHIEEAGLGTETGTLVDGGLCQSGSGDASWSGTVVLCERGSVNFAEKINEVRAHGGLAALIFNNVEGGFLGTCNGACDQPSIPALSLSQADGQYLLANHLGQSTTVIADDGSGCDGCSGSYLAISGTSMATPGVAAALALAWDACGGPAELSNVDMRLLLRASARDLTGTHPGGTGFVYGAGWDRVTGWGLVQLKDAQELGNTLYGSVCPIGLDVSPPRLEVCGADQSSALATVTLDEDGPASVTMSSSGVPAGASGSFNPNPVIAPQLVTEFTLSNLNTVASGTYSITLTATDDADGDNTKDGALELALSAAPPAQPVLSAPLNASTDVALRPELTWSAATDAQQYLVEVATDAGFSSIVYSATVTGTSHTVSVDLQADTEYFWRVTPANFCGDGAASDTFSFTTLNISCQLLTSSDVPKPIQDAGGGPGNPQPRTTESVLNSTVAGELFKVEVIDMKGTHTFISDLSFTLVAPSGQAVEIMERSCGSEDDFHLSLDDDAAGSPGGWPCPPNDGGTYKPSNPLSAFEGTEAGGDWILQITDHFPQDSGNLEGWGLNLCAQAAAGATPSETTIEDIDPVGSQVVGQPWTVTVAVTGDNPTGNVNVSDGTSGTCSFELDSATSCQVTSTSAGTKTVVASYGGDEVHQPSSASTSYEIVKAQTSVNIDLIDPPAEQEVDTPYTVTVSVAGFNPTGTVTVADGTGGECTINLPDASCALSSTTAGAKTITASYPGDGNNEPDVDTAGYTIVDADHPVIEVVPDNLSAELAPDSIDTDGLLISNVNGAADLLWVIEQAYPAVDQRQTMDLGGTVGHDRAAGPQPAGSIDPALAVVESSPQSSHLTGDWNEGFEDITTLPAAGWAMINLSDPLGSTNWFQGNPDVFTAHQGEDNSYIGANFNNASDQGTISNWLITPEIRLRDGTELRFYTRKSADSSWADRLEVRMSTAGDSIQVGDTAESVGDFDQVLLTINPDLIVGEYPDTWTEFVVTLADLPPGGFTGRLAFRYFVTDAGPLGANSDYIGIDTVSIAQPAAGCENPENVSWLSVDTLSGTTTPGEADDVVVTYDSTGLADGAYGSLLCISSNDPVNPLVEVPVLLDVVSVSTYTVTPTVVAGEGSITPADPQTVAENDTTEFTLTPDVGYSIDSVGGSCGGSLDGNTYTTDPVTADCSVEVSFVINSYEVTASVASGNGSIAPASQLVNHGDTAGGTYSADANWSLDALSGDSCSPVDNGDGTWSAANITAACAVTATFVIDNYTLTYSAGANGSISGDSPQTVDHGGDGTSVEAVPDANHHFVQWSDGSTANPRTDTNVTADITVEAEFAIDTYTLTYTAGANGAISGTSPQTVDHGSDGTSVEAVPDANHHFVQWSDGSTANPRTDTNVTADITVEAEFAIDTYTVTFIDHDASVLKIETVDHGSAATAPADPTRPGYTFTGWDESFDSVTSDLTVTAQYKAAEDGIFSDRFEPDI